MEKIVQITSGTGPEECARVVANVLELFLEDARKNNIQASVIEKCKGVLNGTLLSTTIYLSGVESTDFTNRWQGTIQWVSKSPYRLYHKRKNWFVGIEFFEVPKQIKLHESEVSYQTFRSSGPGGQNVNKVETAVRAIHTSTGIQCTASESRSQRQNKKLALEKLKQKVNTLQLSNMASQIQSQWQEHLAVERGNAVMVIKKELR